MRVARQRAHAHFQVVQLVKTLGQVVAHNANKTGRQAALRHQHAASLFGQFADGVGGLHVFRQIKIMHAQLGRQRSHLDRHVEGQRVQHGKLALHRFAQLAGLANLHRLHPQGRSRLELGLGLVRNAQLVAARRLQQHGHGKADLARAQNGDFFAAARSRVVHHFVGLGQLFLGFVVHVFLLGSKNVLVICLVIFYGEMLQAILVEMNILNRHIIFYL